ncbi:hypothetical protein P5634_11965 [Bacillus subtilis]|nr:hypothetical protein P5634_11965 [Bacillus subtilis]
MSKKTVIHDVCNVTMKRKSDGKVIATGEAQTTSISQSIQEDFLKGGWGNRNLYVIKSDKNITGTVKNAFFSLDWLAAQQGVSVENGTVKVWEDEVLTVGAGGALTLSKSPIDTVLFENKDGEVFTQDSTSTEATIPSTFAEPDSEVTARYKVEVEGEIVEIKADTFSEAYELEYHTLEYDPVTEKIYSDLYIQLDKVSPSGETELGFEAGNAITPEMKFSALSENNKLGRFVRVKRKADGSKGEKPSGTTQETAVDLGGAS